MYPKVKNKVYFSLLLESKHIRKSKHSNFCTANTIKGKKIQTEREKQHPKR